jgi:MFS family permease
MIIEGLATVLWAVVSYIICPNVPEKAGFLTENERTFILNRQRFDKTQTSLSFNMSQAKEAVLDYKTWFLFCIYLIWQAVNIAFSTFNPSIIAGLVSGFVTHSVRLSPLLTQLSCVLSQGYSNLNAQLLSAPFNIFNLIIQLAVSWSSDRFNDRSFHLITCGLLAVVGYACIVAIPATPNHSGLLYGLLFFTSFNSGSLTLILGWMTNITIGHTKRVVASSIIIIGSSIGGFVGSLVYQDGSYSRGHIINLTLISVALVLAAVLRVLLMWENRRRDKIALQDPSLAGDDALVEDPDIIVKENFTDKDLRVRYNL